MASGYDDAMLGEPGHGDQSRDHTGSDVPPHPDSSWQNGGHRTRTPDSSYRPRPPASAPGTPNPPPPPDGLRISRPAKVVSGTGREGEEEDLPAVRRGPARRAVSP
ncbi:Rho-type GTPase activating protein Rga1 [Fusarium solani]